MINTGTYMYYKVYWRTRTEGATQPQLEGHAVRNCMVWHLWWFYCFGGHFCPSKQSLFFHYIFVKWFVTLKVVCTYYFLFTISNFLLIDLADFLLIVFFYLSLLHAKQLIFVQGVNLFCSWLILLLKSRILTVFSIQWLCLFQLSIIL